MTSVSFVCVSNRKIKFQVLIYSKFFNAAWNNQAALQLKSSLNWELNLLMAGNKGELQVLIQKSFFFWIQVGV